MAVRFRLDQALAARDDGMTQSELARQSGVSLNTVNAIYHNKTARVDLSTLDALCTVLEVEPGELLDYEGERRAVRRRAVSTPAKRTRKATT